jgi:CHAD domain-containing protein
MGTRTAENRIHFRWPDELQERLYALLMQGGEHLADLLESERGKHQLFKPGKFSVVEDRFSNDCRCYYDTFDWRLYKRGLTLIVDDVGMMLRSAETGETQSSQIFHDEAMGDERRLDTGQTSLGLAHTLPPGSVSDEVAAITRIRALLRIACTRSTIRRFRVLNDDDKTVVEFALRRLALETPSLTPIDLLDAIVYPVRGYGDDQKRLTKVLHRAGFSEYPVPLDYAWILEQTGQKPGIYSAKPPFPITPEQRADEATKTILRALYNVMRANEAGIIADYDTEFLHDYRTSIRRTRSALSQIKKVFPQETNAAYEAAFADLGKYTNELRDLDVYLLERKRYRKMLPKEQREEIDPLFEFLAAKRAHALEEVVAVLQADDYQTFVENWLSFLEAPTADNPRATNAERPIAELARERLLKRYRKLLSEGNRILEERDDKLLHALRIDGKKLRYLLEFFAEVLPKKESKALIKQMKRLQENLGAFNDLSVQQEYLLHVADELPLDDPRMRRTLVAIGRLVEKLSAEQARVRDDFADIFSAFASPANQRLFAKLLNGTEE